MSKKPSVGTEIGNPPARGKAKTEQANAQSQSSNTKQPESASFEALNFKVSPEFKREFQVWAAAHGMKQKDVLQKAFEILKDQHI